MSVRGCILATAAVGAVAGVLPAVAETRGADTALERLLHDDRHTVLVASHRACWKRTSENSVDGIRRCAADGIDIVEIDVRTTRDGVLVLMHDENVDRTSGHQRIFTRLSIHFWPALFAMNGRKMSVEPRCLDRAAGIRTGLISHPTIQSVIIST